MCICTVWLYDVILLIVRTRDARREKAIHEVCLTAIHDDNMLKYPYFIAWSLLFAILISTTTSFSPVNFVGSSFIIHHHDNDITNKLLMVDDSATDISDTFTTHHQRNIIVLCHNVSQDTADGIFDVNNLLKGRIDVLARCITSSLWRSKLCLN